MTENRDPAIKLFGKRIPLPSGGEEGGGEEDKGLSSKREPEAGPGSKKHGDEADGKDDDPTTPVAVEAPKACSDEQETASEKNPKAEEQQSDTSNPQGKPALKKPDKILPCPRCNSLDTKFCYYNNYNVNQPRHFCKNCQRYWTAGGTMRNVPVGAGRRKNKNSAAHYRHLTVSDATLQAIPDSVHPIKPSATVLSFGSSDSPLCESMASVLRLAEKAVKSCARNGFHPTDDGMEEQSSGSPSCAVEEPAAAAAAAAGNCRRFGQHMPTYANGSPWPYPWNPAAPIPVPFYPAPAYWSCSVPGTWTIPWIPAVANASVVSGPNSTTLGKHSREGDVLRHRSSSDKGDATAPNQGGNLWIPKTLRIDDPEEAAKSSIWTAMGFKNDKADPASGGGGMFRAFQSKAELRNHTVEASRALHANPAAMSRSLNFQESS